MGSTCSAALDLDVALLSAPIDGQRQRRADVPADRLPHVVLAQLLHGLAVDREDFVVDREAGPVRALPGRDPADEEPPVRRLAEEGPDGARGRRRARSDDEGEQQKTQQ
jgi:hypothetical protein